MEAFKEAIDDDNFIGFELDVRISKDNIFVIHHDSLVDGRLIKNLTYQELKQKGICRLKEVLRMTTNKLIMVEIKDVGIDIYKLNDMLNKSKKNIYVMSFNNNLIKKYII